MSPEKDLIEVTFLLLLLAAHFQLFMSYVLSFTVYGFFALMLSLSNL